MPKFKIDALYTRDQVAELIPLATEKRKGGNWATGYSKWNGEFYIFCGVGTPGRTGHDYVNKWVNGKLHWQGKTFSNRSQPQIRDLISNRFPVHVFWREHNRDPFRYAGEARQIQYDNSTPINVIWDFQQSTQNTIAAPQNISKTITTPTTINRDTGQHRGPAPQPGERNFIITDGPTNVYIMKLNGPSGQMFPKLPLGAAIFKIGITNDLARRCKELNFGFPPGSSLQWEIEKYRKFPDGRAAYLFEDALIRHYQSKGSSLGGEYIWLPSGMSPDLTRLPTT